jgi:putative membrane protein (TIGR04086 family)
MSGSRFSAGSLRLLLRALAAWCLCALLLLPILSFYLARSGTSSRVIGYLSSAVSFVCAAAAGYAGAEVKNGRALLQGLLIGVFLLILLLSVGFLVSGKGQDSSGVLSVVCFTLSGCVVGSVRKNLRGRKARKVVSRRRGKGTARFP